MRLSSIVVLTAMLTASLAAHADTITLDTAKSSGGTYEYTYNSSSGTTFTGSAFMFTGLSGVTGASTKIPSFFTVSFTSTSVSFGFTNSSSSAFAGTYTDLFAINSSVLIPGAVQYSIPSTPAQTGTVLGPVAVATGVTPEPSSFVLFSTGVLGIFGVARERFASRRRPV